MAYKGTALVSVLVFPVLFCGLVALIFSFPGVSFSLIAWSMAAAVFVLIPAGSFLLRWLLPEKRTSAGIAFPRQCLIAILGIIATVNGRTAVKGIDEVDWGALAGLTILLVAGALVGMILRKVKLKRQTN